MSKISVFISLWHRASPKRYASSTLKGGAQRRRLLRDFRAEPFNQPAVRASTFVPLTCNASHTPCTFSGGHDRERRWSITAAGGEALHHPPFLTHATLSIFTSLPPYIRLTYPLRHYTDRRSTRSADDNGTTSMSTSQSTLSSSCEK